MRTSHRRRWSLALLALPLLAAPALAQPQQPGATARLDSDGDPLPPGAVLRVGTKRWRHGREARSLVWTPDGKQLAFISENAVRVLDSDTGRLLRVFVPRVPAGEVVRPVGLAIPRGGEELAVRSGGQIFTFELATGKHLRSFETKIEGFDDDGGNVSYSADGKYLAFAEGTGYAVLDRRTGEAIVQDDTKAGIQGIAFTRDSTRLVVASLKPSLKVWDLAKREIAARWSFSDDQFVWGPGVSPDGKFVGVGLDHIEIVDPFAGEVKARLLGDSGKDLFLQLDFTSDGKQFVAASQEGQVYVWRTSDWSRQFKLTGDAWVVRSMALRPDGKRVAVGDARNRIWVWNLETGELLFNNRAGHDTEVHAIAFTPDGQTLITGGGARDTNLWSVRTGEHLRNLNSSSSTLAFSPDGKQLVTAWYGAPQLRTWNLDAGTQVSEWTAPEPRLRAFAFTADQSLLTILLEIDEPRGFRLLRRTWPALAEAGDVRQEGYTRGSLAVSPDGRLAVLAPPGKVEIWQLPEGRVVAELPNPQHYCDNLLFSPDGRFVLGTNSDTTLRVWEVASLKQVHALAGHARVPSAIAAHPSGRYLASAEGSRSFPVEHAEPLQVRFWDILAGKQVAVLSGHDENVSALAFSPNGKLLAAGMRDTTTLVWNVPAAAQAAVMDRKPLTAGEAEALWRDLAAEDAHQGQAAVQRLSLDPDRALELAERQLSPIQPPRDADVARLIAGLDAEEFKDRAAAFEQLAGLGSVIAPQLRAAIAQTSSAEVKLQCGTLLQRAQQKYPQSGVRLSQTRSVQLLEQLADERAKALLTKLAGGAAEAHLTSEAQGALKRLGKRPAAQ